MLRSDELEVIPYAGPPCTFDQRRRVDLGQLATPPFELVEAHPGGLRQAEALQMLQRERADLRLAPEPDEIGMCDGQRVPPTLGKSLSNSSVRARFAASRDAWSP